MHFVIKKTWLYQHVHWALILQVSRRKWGNIICFKDNIIKNIIYLLPRIYPPYLENPPKLTLGSNLELGNMISQFWSKLGTQNPEIWLHWLGFEFGSPYLETWVSQLGTQKNVFMLLFRNPDHVTQTSNLTSILDHFTYTMAPPVHNLDPISRTPELWPQTLDPGSQAPKPGHDE